MPIPVRRTARARLDYLDIFIHVAGHNAPAAERLVRSFDEAILLLQHMPKCGPARAEIGRDVRSYPVGKYLVLYRIADDAIELLRVVHGSRKMRGILKRP